MNAPADLFKFDFGADTLRLTSWPVDMTMSNDLTVWSAADIGRDQIESSLESIPESVLVRFRTHDNDSPLRALRSRFYMRVVRVEIFETDADDLTYDPAAPVFRGRIGAPSYGERGLIALPVMGLLNPVYETIPRIQASRIDNLRPGDAFSGVNESTFTTSGVIAALGSSPLSAYLEATAFGDKATAESDANWFALGRVTVGDEVRLCVRQSGNRLYIDAPFLDAAVGGSVSAVAGYTGRIEQRESKFEDVEAFMGFPYIPNRNPQFEPLQTPKQKGGKKS